MRREAVTLRGMRFHTLVGILPHERELPQPLEVDVTVWLTPPNGGGRVIDYRRLYELVAGVVAAPIGYLEDAAAAISDAVLRVERVERARVAVRKPQVPLPGPVAHAEVVVVRDRA